MYFLFLEGGINMLPHCGKWINATGIVHATAITPIQVRPDAVENLVLEKKTNWVNPPPKFPPAPVSPEIMPKERRETNGMIPYAAPHAA